MKESVKEIPQGYKDSPLGIIPQDWEVKRLGDVCTNNGDYGINAPAVDYSESLPTYLRITDIDDSGHFQSLNKKSVRCDDYDFYVLKKGDIVFARTGATVGKSYLYKETDGVLVFAGFLIRFVPETSIALPEFIKYYTETTSYWEWVSTISLRSGQPGINSKEYCSLMFPLPPLSQQQKIVEVLSTWDLAIEKQTLKIQKLELRKKGLMQQLLTGKKRLPGFTEPWQTVRLGDVFKERNEINCKNLPLLSIGIDGVYPQSESMKKDTSNEDKSKYKRICKNDIGYNTMRMWQGRSALSKMEGIVSPAYTIVVPQKTINPEFMAVYIKTPTAINLFWRHSQGLVKDTLNCKYSMFSKIIVSIPKLDEQTAIANILSEADKEITLEKNKLSKLQLEKKGLMQQLLTGKKIVSA